MVPWKVLRNACGIPLGIRALLNSLVGMSRLPMQMSAQTTEPPDPRFCRRSLLLILNTPSPNKRLVASPFPQWDEFGWPHDAPRPMDRKGLRRLRLGALSRTHVPGVLAEGKDLPGGGSKS